MGRSARYVGPGLLPNKMKFYLHSTAQQHHDRCWLWLSLQDVQRANHMRCSLYEALRSKNLRCSTTSVHEVLRSKNLRCSTTSVHEVLRSKNLRCSTTRSFRKYSGDQTASLDVLNRSPTRISYFPYLTDMTSRSSVPNVTALAL